MGADRTGFFLHVRVVDHRRDAAHPAFAAFASASQIFHGPEYTARSLISPPAYAPWRAAPASPRRVQDAHFQQAGRRVYILEKQRHQDQRCPGGHAMSLNRFCAFSLSFLAGSCVVTAQADPRSDVLSAAGCCNAITDYRSWLECDQRLALPSCCGPYGNPRLRLRRRWLWCRPPPARRHGLKPPISQSSCATAPPDRTAMPRSQSAIGSSLGGDDDYVPKQRIAAYSFDRAGLFSVTFADGQTWKQVEQDSIYAHWRGPADSYTGRCPREWWAVTFCACPIHISDRVSRVSGAAKP